MFDIQLAPVNHHLCNGQTRRDFLRVGALGALGLSLPTLLAADQIRTRANLGAPRAKSVILVFLGGGISHHDSFDMKPDAMEEIRGKYSSIPTSVTGLRICELMPKMAKIMNKVALVRSGTHENDHHETATNWVLSGRFGTPSAITPPSGPWWLTKLAFQGLSLPTSPSLRTPPSLGSLEKVLDRGPLRVLQMRKSQRLKIQSARSLGPRHELSHP